MANLDKIGEGTRKLIEKDYKGKIEIKSRGIYDLVIREDKLMKLRHIETGCMTEWEYSMAIKDDYIHAESKPGPVTKNTQKRIYTLNLKRKITQCSEIEIGSKVKCLDNEGNVVTYNLKLKKRRVNEHIKTK